MFADSDYRISMAYLATARGDLQRVLVALGTNETETPIHDGLDLLATVLRTNARREKLGDVDGARALLLRFIPAGRRCE